MTEADLGTVLRDALLLAAKLGGPPLAVALAVGLLVSVLQAATQVNESSLVFVPKLMAIGLTLLLLGGFMVTQLGDFTRALFDRLVAIGGQ